MRYKKRVCGLDCAIWASLPRQASHGCRPISRMLSHSVERKPLEIMGQYYKFVNTTKKAESTIPLPFNFNLPHAKSLENSSREELQEKFDFVIQNNSWDKDDVVIAIGDYGTIVYYPED